MSEPHEAAPPLNVKTFFGSGDCDSVLLVSEEGCARGGVDVVMGRDLFVSLSGQRHHEGNMNSRDRGTASAVAGECGWKGTGRLTKHQSSVILSVPNPAACQYHDEHRCPARYPHSNRAGTLLPKDYRTSKGRE